MSHFLGILVPPRRTAAVLLLLLLPACGQKPGTLSTRQVAVAQPSEPSANESPAASPGPTPRSAAPAADAADVPSAQVSSGTAQAAQPSQQAAGASEAAASPQVPAPQPPQPAPSKPVPAPDYGAVLMGHSFTSFSVSELGRPRALVAGTTIDLAFERRADVDVVRWTAGCNHYGADVVVNRTALDVVPNNASTSVGCPDDRNAQDDWLDDFMESDPTWSLDTEAAVLTLTSDDTEIQLRATA